MGCSKSSPKREQDKHWIDNLTLHLKLEKEEEEKTQKLVEGRNHKDTSRNKWKRNERNNSKD